MPDDNPKVRGDGGSAPVTPDTLTWLKGEIQTLQTEASTQSWVTRQDAEKVRFCRWEGQSSDGRKHERANSGKPVTPFEGASDARIPLTDMIINERVMIQVLAAARAHAKVTGLEITDAGWAGKIVTLLTWVLTTQLGRSWWRELVKLAQYANGDSPAVGLLGIFWNQERALKRTVLEPGDALARLAEMFGETADPALLASAGEILLNAERLEDGVALLQGLLPSLKPARARKILKAWQAGEAAEFPEPYVRTNVPKVMALRLGVDVFVPANTTEIRRARWIFHREMISRAELEARAVSHGYAPKFVEQLIGAGTQVGAAGQTSLPDGYHVTSPVGSLQVSEPAEDFKGLYEVITAYWKDVNEDGILGIYTVPFSAFAEVTARDRELLDYAHGEYPYVEFVREILSDRLLDSRSVAELTQTPQQTLKQQHDMKNDAAELGTIPPIKVPRDRPDVPLRIGPLKQLKERRPGEYSWMPPPEFPSVAKEQVQETRRQVDEYWGRTNPEVDPELVILHRQFMVNQFLSSLADAFGQMIQLCQQYMTDAEVARVVGGAGMPIARTVQEIQGKFDLALDFDVRTMNPEYVLKLAEAVSQWVLPADTQQTVQRDRYVAMILGAINPQLAEATMRPVEQANYEELKDEDANLAKIMAGVEPPMVEQGQNFGLRLARLEENVEKNPNVVLKMTPDSRAILDARVQHLRFQVSQEENKQIGRVGAKPALEG